jgi:lysyl-tRNA synthetase, class II
MKSSGEIVYPHKFHVSTSFTDYIEKYSTLTPEQVSDDKVTIAGRVYSKRAMGRALRFFDLRSESQKIQIMATAKYITTFRLISKTLYLFNN